jgi:hypothetical protein
MVAILKVSPLTVLEKRQMARMLSIGPRAFRKEQDSAVSRKQVDLQIRRKWIGRTTLPVAENNVRSYTQFSE